MIRISRAHYPVHALGPGTRAAIWVQGCSIGCAGCCSKDTWALDGGDVISPGALVDWLSGLPLLDGVTISGGEPFDQPAALLELLRGIRGWERTRREPLDVLVFSGYTTQVLRRKHAAVLEHIDVLVGGPYLAARGTPSTLAGSDNQVIELLTPLAGSRYYLPAVQARPAAPTLQVDVLDGTAWMVGLPAQGDLARLREGLRARGVVATWTDELPTGLLASSPETPR